jgi:hypothetical protein
MIAPLVPVPELGLVAVPCGVALWHDWQVLPAALWAAFDELYAVVTVCPVAPANAAWQELQVTSIPEGLPLDNN